MGRVSISVTGFTPTFWRYGRAHFFLRLVPAAIACFADWNARDMHSFGRMGVATIAGYAATSLYMVMFAKFTVPAGILDPRSRWCGAC